MDDVIRACKIAQDNANDSAVPAGTHVMAVQKRDQRIGEFTEGIVKDIHKFIHTSAHIKVRLENGIVGRVQEIKKS